MLLRQPWSSSRDKSPCPLPPTTPFDIYFNFRFLPLSTLPPVFFTPFSLSPPATPMHYGGLSTYAGKWFICHSGVSADLLMRATAPVRE